MKLLMLLPIVASLTFPLTTLAVDHSHHAVVPQKIELNAGKKWETDAPLRQAMSAIRSSVTSTLETVHGGKATEASYDKMAIEVAGQVSYIVQNCKLDPKADAQLHIVIGDIMSALETVEGKQQGRERASGVIGIAGALNTYGKHFSHSGWRAIDLRH